MFKTLTSMLAALLVSSAGIAATLNPISLLNPIGSTAGQAITSTGPSTPPAWSSVTLDGISGFNTTGFVYRNSTNSYVIITPPIIQGVGGTGLSNIAAHQLLVGGALNAMTAISPGATGTIFSSNGTAADPSYRTLASLGIAPLAGATFTAQVNAGYTNAIVNANDTSGAGVAKFALSSNGTLVWDILKGSGASGGLFVERYVAGTFVDNPIQIANTTGVVAFSARPTFAGNAALDVANGAALAGSASQTFSVGTATTAAHAVRFDQAIGIGQTIQDVTASRVITTTYTNSTGKAIAVMVSAVVAGAGGAISVTMPTGIVWGSSASAIGQFSAATVVVPNGATYRVDVSGGGTPTLKTWIELR